MTDFSAYQFDILLPFGLTIEEDATIGSRYSNSGLSVSMKKLVSDYTAKKSRYRFVFYDIDGGTITGTSGALMNVNIKASKNLANRDYEGSIENIVFVESDGTQSVLDKVRFNITVSGYEGGMAGDANCDGIVNVADIICIANYILGNNPARFDEEAANVNGDSVINVADIIKLANIILYGDSASVKARRSEVMREPQ